MFEYEWGNPSTILFPPAPANDHDHDHDHDHGLSNSNTAFHHNRQPAENPFSSAAGDITSFNMPPTFLPLHGLHHPNQTHNHNYNHHHHSLMDPRAFHTASSYPPTAPGPPLLSSSDFDSSAFFTLPKTEPPGSAFDCPNNANNNGSDIEIGLNLGLGGRTYFSAADEDFLSRLYRRSRPFDGGVGGSLAANSPKCQAEGCNADLSNAKHYHRRHKVCEFHSKASTVVAGGLTQRFCQQCSRFHLLTEFDNGKRSCRRRLADHNRRRRKSHQQTAAARPSDNTGNSSSCSENPPRSPSESRAQSVSSATVASSPMQESKPACYHSSSASPSSIYY